jgi:hypothetical protein
MTCYIRMVKFSWTTIKPPRFKTYPLLLQVNFFFANSGGWSPNLVHSATRTFTVLLCLPRVIVKMENYSAEWRLTGGTEVLGENLSTTNPTWPDPGLKPARRGGKPATNRLSYGAANSPASYSSPNIFLAARHFLYLEALFWGRDI